MHFSYSFIYFVFVDFRESPLTHVVTNELCTAVLAHHACERAHLFMKLKKAAQDVIYLMHVSMYGPGCLTIEHDSDSGCPSVISPSEDKPFVAIPVMGPHDTSLQGQIFKTDSKEICITFL